jgi:hypothetical protein
MRAFSPIVFAIVILFCGCGKKPEPISSRSVSATIKTPRLSLAQSGFIDALENDAYRLQIYSAGQSALELTVGEKICKGFFCLSSAEFNARYLSENYPPNLLRDILAQRTIAGLENGAVKTTKKGFEQKAAIEGKYAIAYEKDGDTQRFRDTINRVLIVIRRAD